jgi:hypothetical protein
MGVRGWGSAPACTVQRLREDGFSDGTRRGSISEVAKRAF